MIKRDVEKILKESVFDPNSKDVIALALKSGSIEYLTVRAIECIQDFQVSKDEAHLTKAIGLLAAVKLVIRNPS